MENDEDTVLTFRPSYEELLNFERFVMHMEKCGAHERGIAKILLPREWSAQSKGYEIRNIEITFHPILQRVTGGAGVYTLMNLQLKPMTLHEFVDVTNKEENKPPRCASDAELDDLFWKNISYHPPLYGADIPGSLTDNTVWNLEKMGTILDDLKKDCGIRIGGVNSTYLYFGMWKSMFAWHTEDMDLYSCNYLHFGAPKTWYAIPPKYGFKFERIASTLFPHQAQQCRAFLRHKVHMISPRILKEHSIRYHKVVQNPGEMIITFPFAYHAGFNHGFNCAEATNFASRRWINYGKWASVCTCVKDAVYIDMNIFVRKYQPHLYHLWKQGCEKGSHPESLKRVPVFVPCHSSKRRRKPTASVKLQNGTATTVEYLTPKWQPFVRLKRVPY